MCLQALSAGWTTVLLHSFLVQKLKTMLAKGGNTQKHYKNPDGRLLMARTLERRWPGTVTVTRRWGRPQHQVASQWKHFDTPLKLKPGIDLSALASNEYGMELQQVADSKEIKSDYVKGLVESWKEGDR
jgi:hypothetical protein